MPLEKAFALGCDRVAVILTKPIAPEQTGARDKKLAKLLRHRYPAAAKGLALRAEHYNQTVRRALKLEQQGTVCIVAPDSTEGMATLTKDKQALEAMYRKGWQDAGKLIECINRLKFCKQHNETPPLWQTPERGCFIAVYQE